jgi:outer membrane protein assembly factor BamB
VEVTTRRPLPCHSLPTPWTKSKRAGRCRALDGAAYFVKKTGVVQCVDLKNGHLRWQRRLPGEAWASPIAHKGYVIYFTKNGSVATLNPQDGHDAMTENSISAAGFVDGVAAAKDS